MKTKLLQLIVFSFIVVSLVIVTSMLVVLPPQLKEGCGVKSAYAKPPPGPPPGATPEPSTLLLLATGLAAGGSIYAIRRYLNRNKKN